MDQGLQWAGLDTSTREFAVCVVDRAGKVVREARLPADIAAADEFLGGKASGIVSVALETGTTSIHPARALRELGYDVSLFHALSVHRFVRMKLNKTDANDARGLAEIARAGGGQVQKVYLKPVELSVLRTKLVMRERLLQMRKVNETAMMSLFHAFGVRANGTVSSQKSLRRIVGEMIAAVESRYDIPIRTLAKPLLDLSISLRRDELRIEKDLKNYVIKSDVGRRLMEIPGVGVITAVSFITAIGDPARFSRSDDVGAYFGLTPRVWKTGAYSRKRGISKIGNALTRRHLHMAARAALNTRTENSLQIWGRVVAARSNRKTAIVAMARKLAVLMFTIWKNGSKYEPERSLPRRI
jgi:transposase